MHKLERLTERHDKIVERIEDIAIQKNELIEQDGDGVKALFSPESVKLDLRAIGATTSLAITVGRIMVAEIAEAIKE